MKIQSKLRSLFVEGSISQTGLDPNAICCMEQSLDAVFSLGCKGMTRLFCPNLSFLPAVKHAGQRITKFRSEEEEVVELVVLRQASQIELATAFIECSEVNQSFNSILQPCQRRSIGPLPSCFPCYGNSLCKLGMPTSLPPLSLSLPLRRKRRKAWLG